MLDTTSIEKLQTLMGEQFALAITMYIQQMEATLETMRSFHMHGDLDKVEIAAHRLKASSRQFGAFMVAEHLEVIEQLARNSNASEILPKIDDLHEQYQIILPELETYKK